jgi:hypothetical protein
MISCACLMLMWSLFNVLPPRFERIRIMRVLRFFNNKCRSSRTPACTVECKMPLSPQILPALAASAAEGVRCPTLTSLLFSPLEF